MMSTKKAREILLIEPNYKCKYPPMGLMKIATYYKSVGDNVTFFKGDLKDLVIENAFKMLKKELYSIDDSVFWEKYYPEIRKFLKNGQHKNLEYIPNIDDKEIFNIFIKFRKFIKNEDYFKNEHKIYDRVGITTLFTFHWDITVKTINFAKKLCKSQKDVMVGGVMASILPDEIERATGIRPFVGILDEPGVLDDDNDIIIDELPLDYSILEEIDYEYPTSNAYFAYMTRGCVNKCPFCAVPKLEPNYKEYLPISEQIKYIDERFGPKRDLLLLDNNVLASCKFPEIINDIKKSGFSVDSKYIRPNLFEIAIQNLKNGLNDKGYVNRCVKEFNHLLNHPNTKNKQYIYNLLAERNLLETYTATKSEILSIADELKPYFEKLYSKIPVSRSVDFNQGIDSRLFEDDKIALLAEIPIKPVRIAFDHWKLHEIYEKAVRMAASYNLNHLSNYLLYNFEDKPEELYYRLELNVKLANELGVSIYSFPMKYHPIEDPEYFSNRNFIGKYWNRKFIRAIQSILNSTHGKVGYGKNFFEHAFGQSVDEFYKILYMPEEFIIYRENSEKSGVIDRWWSDFNSLSEKDKAIAKNIIERNNFKDLNDSEFSEDVVSLIKYYRMTVDHTNNNKK